MTRQEVLLAILAASGGRPYTPVQIQKAAFLVTVNLPRLVSEGRNYEFVPYDYGPFDSSVYADVESLREEGLAEIVRAPGVKWKKYSASDDGIDRGAEILNNLSEKRREYIKTVSKWVRKQDFQQLVKSIYEAYPEMRENSIFSG